MYIYKKPFAIKNKYGMIYGSDKQYHIKTLFFQTYMQLKLSKAFDKNIADFNYDTKLNNLLDNRNYLSKWNGIQYVSLLQ